MPKVSMTVNGKAVTADADARTLLVQYLREGLRLTGTHVGCDTSQCGACVVHVDGKAVKACTMFAWQAEGATVLTIDGLAQNGTLLTYNVDAQIGGKLAQLGQRLINGAAKKMADDFFKKFAAAVGTG